MLIDLILDRKDGLTYDPRDFYYNLMVYGGTEAEAISKAMDEGNEKDVREALCAYVLRENYNPAICDYIQAVKWLEEDDEEAEKTYTAISNHKVIFRGWCFRDMNEIKATCRGAIMGIRQYRKNPIIDVYNNRGELIWRQQ